ncbi:hypothetical protein [Prosthecobacter sp.]|uniref:hypothetical protein n=1 Tax=Prosthecobacter sp. TaxID=1965333 RepID=UPI0037849255
MKKEFITLLGFAGVAAAAGLVWCAAVHGYCKETDYTCVRCRAERHETQLFGGPVVNVVSGAGAPWFAAHVPEHAHEWRWSGRTETHGLLWVSCGCGGRNARHAIWMVEPEEQARFLEQATPEEAETFYAGLESPDLAVQLRSVRMVSDNEKEIRRRRLAGRGD